MVDFNGAINLFGIKPKRTYPDYPVEFVTADCIVTHRVRITNVWCLFIYELVAGLTIIEKGMLHISPY